MQEEKISFLTAHAIVGIDAPQMYRKALKNFYFLQIGVTCHTRTTTMKFLQHNTAEHILQRIVDWASLFFGFFGTTQSTLIDFAFKSNLN